MYAVLVRANIKDSEQAESFLKSEVVPNVSQAPGFVAGYWVRRSESEGNSVLVFESEDAAKAVADNIQDPPIDAVELDSVVVGEVVASA